MEKVSKHFPGVQALEQVDFEIYPGEILGLVGENGAGKSTLIKILSGVYTKDDGLIQFRGQPFDFRSPHAAQEHGIVTIYQELALVPEMTVGENLFLGNEPRRGMFMIDWDRVDRESRALLAKVGHASAGGRTGSTRATISMPFRTRHCTS